MDWVHDKQAYCEIHLQIGFLSRKQITHMRNSCQSFVQTLGGTGCKTASMLLPHSGLTQTRQSQKNGFQTREVEPSEDKPIRRRDEVQVANRVK